jgi:hypothetical protein
MLEKKLDSLLTDIKYPIPPSLPSLVKPKTIKLVFVASLLLKHASKNKDWPESEYSLMCQSGVTCLPIHLFSLLDTNNFISEGGRGEWDILYLSVENPIFFQASGRSKIFKRYMHTRHKKIIPASLCSYLHALIAEKQQIPIL